MGITKGNIKTLDIIERIEETENSDIDQNSILDGAYDKNTYGSYIHGIFDEKEVVTAFILAVASLKNKKGRLEEERFKAFVENLNVTDCHAFKEEQYDILANTLRESLDMKKIYGLLKDSVI